MRPSAYLLCAALCFASTFVQAAGVRFFNVPAGAGGKPLTGAVWYPCNAPPQEATVADPAITGAIDCPVVGDRLPLVVVSHGRAGWFGGHHDMAAALADAGFVVAAINHPGDNTADKSRVDKLSVLVERPADVKRLIDFMLDSFSEAPKIDKDRIGLFGFSMGGYTGLVVIGGIPDFRKGLPGCEGSDFLACKQIQNDEVPIGPPVHDPRVKAAVIVDPGPGIFFPAENLNAVRVPIQLWSSDPKLASVFTSGCCALGINHRLPLRPDFRLVPNAIHFSFLPVCSAAEVQQFPRICTDAPGFDRTAFQQRFHSDVIAFFRKHLFEVQNP